MSQIGWILFTAACAAGLLIMIPFMICEMGREAQKNGMEQ